MALEKIKEANVKKLFIKAFTSDGSTKSLLVDEKMTVAFVTRLLADKNHVKRDTNWALVELLPDLHMERAYEDHEQLVENLLMWKPCSWSSLAHSIRRSSSSLVELLPRPPDGPDPARFVATISFSCVPTFC